MPRKFSTIVESQPPPTRMHGRRSSSWPMARTNHAESQRLLERLHLEVEGVDEARVDGRAVDRVVPDAEEQRGAQIAVVRGLLMTRRRCCITLGDPRLRDRRACFE